MPLKGDEERFSFEKTRTYMVLLSISNVNSILRMVWFFVQLKSNDLRKNTILFFKRLGRYWCFNTKN